MKRVIAILVTIFYLLPVVGYGIDLHWCCKKIASVSFSSTKHSECSHCCKSPSKKCCKTTHIDIKLKDVYSGSFAEKVQPKNGLVYTIFYASGGTLLTTTRLNAFRAHSPPFDDTQPVYLANSVFRI